MYPRMCAVLGVVVLACVLVALLSSPALAGTQLIVDGEFEGVGGFSVAASGWVDALTPTGAWYASGWTRNSGVAGSDGKFADHDRWSDRKLIQFFTLAPGASLSALSFEYILPKPYYTTTRASVLGFTGAERVYMSGGGSVEPTVLATTGSLFTADDWTGVDLDLPGAPGYDAYAVLFQFSSDDMDLIRGVDNVQLTAIPEPATVSLFAFALIGLGLARRRRKA